MQLDVDIPVDKKRSTTGGQSGLSYLQLSPQQEDSPEHANWDMTSIYKQMDTSEGSFPLYMVVYNTSHFI